jgi:hypothetical protein
VNLRELDDRVLPVLARRLQRAPRPSPPPAAPVPEQPVGGEGQVAARPARGPAPVILRLREVDDRYARGPLALVREIPQLGFLFLAVLLLVSGASVLQRRSDDAAGGPGRSGIEGPASPGADGDLTLGPVLGDDVPTYLAESQQSLQRRADGADADEPAWAVVSFRSYLGPDQVASTLRDPRAAFVLFRVPPKAGTQAEPSEPIPVGKDTATGIRSAFAAVARGKLEEAEGFDELARTSENDPAFQEAYRADAAQRRAEAAVLAKGCACVFAALVRATPKELLALSTVPEVRVVDLAPAGAELDTLQVRGLLPEEKVTVTGGNEGSPGGNG